MNDPIITDNTVMTRAEKRFSAQAYCVLVLTCKGKALQVVQQVPRGYGFEAWKQLCKEYEPHPPVKPQGMRQALLSSTKSAEPVQTVHHQGNGDRRSVRKRLSASKQAKCVASGSTDLTELAPLGEEEDDEPARLKEHFGWWEAGTQR